MWNESFLDPFARVLVDATLKTTLLLVVASAASGLLRRSGAAVRHLIWSAALVCALAMPLLVSALPPWRVASWPAWTSQGSATVESRSLAAGVPAEGSLAGNAGRVSAPRPPASVQEAAAPAGTSPEQEPEGGSAASAGILRLVADRNAWLVAAWLAGALAVLTVLVAGLRRTWALGLSATDLSDHVLVDDARALGRDIGLRRPVRLRLATVPVIPMTWGVLRPVILLPPEAVKWSAPRRRAVLMHELAHVKRGDYLLQLLAQIACAVYWFHPLVWLGAVRLRVERERASDDQVLRSGSRASEYATQLLEMAQSLQPGALRLAPAVAMAQTSQIGSRLRDILDARRRRTLLTPRLGVAASLVVTLVALPLAAVTGAPPTRILRAEQAARDDLARVEEAVERALAASEAALAHHDANARAAPVDRAPAAAQEQLEEVRRLLAASEELRQQTTAADAERLAAEVQALAAAQADLGTESEALAATASKALAAAEDELRATAEALASAEDDRLAEVSIQLPFSTWIESDGDRMRVRLRTDGRTIKLESDGKIAFADSEDDIVHISAGGYFRLEERVHGRVRHEIELRGRDGGVLERKYEVGGKKSEFDAEGRRWLAGILPEILRRTGYDVEGRVQRILQRGGKDAVLREIEQISSDSVERRYYTQLLQHGDLDAAALRQVSQHAAQHIRSDFERAEFLIAVATDPASDAAARAAYAEATRDMRSDFERRRALKALLEHGKLDAAGTQALLLSAAEIRSDYELAELLIDVAEQAPLDAATTPRFFIALGSIGSDFELRRVLDSVVRRGDRDAPMIQGLLRAALDVGSDFEQAQFLVHLAKRYPIDPLWRADYFAAVETIGSSFERRRALRGLLGQTSLDADALRGTLQAAADMSSNFEMAELLIEMVEKHSIPAELRPEYFDTARRIGSNHERGRVLSAAAERGL